ncbi:hypothetical protein EZV73_19895 [Acidaminobacter sp. JC074]|uniref:alcohol dehydrogenase catalytic domain-containing protein n=1 Tax=Acidaminobacter sp. JC074 TaxID=2530199 RepID=UPI001F0D32AD|nr:alcohol dehydrogenase catalytic domain-containing protein [Acidaminobacter sp. JC074]MCH4889856.1 hypothetical protein [Acidaminobacter sp. JC074]
MKAVYYEHYGSPDVVILKELERPVPKDNEVLVKIVASSINFADYACLTGSPFPIKLVNGLFGPKNKILGMDYSGVVEALGKEVKSFQVGDHVFGELSDFGMGAFSEYRCIDEKILTKK